MSTRRSLARHRAGAGTVPAAPGEGYQLVAVVRYPVGDGDRVGPDGGLVGAEPQPAALDELSPT